MNSFVEFFLKIRNSSIFSGIVIAVIVASAIYAVSALMTYHLSTPFTWIYSIMPLLCFS